MKIFKVTFNEYDYDQYDSFIVVAENEEDAVKVIEEGYPRNDQYSGVDWSKGYTVEEVLPIERGTVLGSFNAG